MMRLVISFDNWSRVGFMDSSVGVQAMRLLADNDFQTLSAHLHRMNVFKAVGMARQEIKHSAFLAWLMDPSAPHAMGDRFLRFLLARLLEDNQAEGFASVTVDDLSDVIVTRERESNIDILVRTRDRRLIICIENKVDSGLHDQQLKKYWHYIEKTYGDYRHKIYVFLTPRGDDVPEEECEERDWFPLSYSTIAQVLESLRPAASERTGILIDDYVDLLKEENIVEDVELNQLASNLYKRYADVFNLVNDRCGGTSVVANALRGVYLEVLEQLKNEHKISDCSPLDMTGIYLSFQTRRMDEFLHAENLPESGSWGKNSTAYHYWIYPPLLAPSIKLEVGPLNQSEDIIYKMRELQNAGNSRKSPITNLDRYRTIKRIQTGIDASSMNDDDELDVNDIKRRLIGKIEDMLFFEKRTLDTIEDQHSDK